VLRARGELHPALASTEEVRKTFFDLAQKWNVLATDLDTAQALLDAAKGDKL